MLKKRITAFAAHQSLAKRWCLLGSGAGAGLYMVVTVVFTGAEKNCHSPVDADRSIVPGSQSTMLCQSHSEISWQAWVAGNSPSYQFHFLDLLELLYGGNNDGQFNAAPKGMR